MFCSIFCFQFANDALSCFESFKLDDNKLSRKSDSHVEDKLTQSKNYFAKYLTSEKVMLSKLYRSEP